MLASKIFGLTSSYTIPTKYGYRRSKLAIGSYASVQNIRFNIIIHFLIQWTPKNTKKYRYPHVSYIFGKPWACSSTWCNLVWVILLENLIIHVLVSFVFLVFLVSAQSS